MIIWLNGAFGAGKTTVAYELHRRIPESYVFDPENLGYFIRKNSPGIYNSGDFQDIPFWREGNYKMLSMLGRDYSGTLIVPMTLKDEAYYDEIIGRLRRDGAELKHIILYAQRDTIFKRLKKRSGSLQREKFAADAADGCIAFFDRFPESEKIVTDEMSVDDMVRAAAEKCGIELLPDRRNGIGKALDRLKTTLGHIR